MKATGVIASLGIIVSNLPGQPIAHWVGQQVEDLVGERVEQWVGHCIGLGREPI